MIVLATHFTLIDGKKYEAPASTLIEILERDAVDCTIIRHSIDGRAHSTVTIQTAGGATRTRQLPVARGPAPLRYVAEVVSSVVVVALRRKPCDAYVGVDPLNAAAGIVLRRLRLARKVVFFTVDYTPTRFENTLLNKAYHLVDRWCVRRADVVWSVSSRIVDERRRLGVPEERNLFVPNVPAKPEGIPVSPVEREHHTIITLGILGPQQDYLGLIDAVALVRADFPDCRLTIVGNGPSGEALGRHVADLGLEAAVRFTGHLSHAEALREISRSGIGAAVYNGVWSFNHYGDSMKCREFMYFGLPILTTDTHATADEIREVGAGIVCEQSANAYAAAIRKIFSAPDRYRRSSLALAGKHANVHERLLATLTQMW